MKIALNRSQAVGGSVKQKIRAILSSLVMLVAGTAWGATEAPQPDRQQVLTVARDVAGRLQPFLDDKIHVVQVFRKETSPLLAIPSTDNMCIIVLNTNDSGWAVWDRFLGNLPDESRNDMIEIAVAHELGHCFRNRTPPASLALAPVNRETKPSSSDSETYADIFAGAYARLYMADRAEVPMERLIHLRKRFSWLEWDHATGNRLATAWTRLKSQTRDQLQTDYQTPQELVEVLTQ